MKAKQIVVGQVQAYGAKVGGGTISGTNEINSLATGAIAVLTEAGVLVTTGNAGTVLDDVRRFYIAVGNQQTGAAALSLITVPIPRTKTSYTKSAYTAPVKLRKFVGYDGANGTSLQTIMSTFAVGNEVMLKIINTTPGLRTLGAVEGQEVFRYSYTAVPGDTNLTMITKLIAKINADGDRIVNATVVGSQTGIQLDAIANGTTFSMAMDGEISYATVEQPEGTVGNSVALVYGVGTSDQVKVLEDLYFTLRGKTSRREFVNENFSHPSLVVDGQTYILYNFSWNDFRTQAMQGEQATSHYDVVVALPDGQAVVTSFDTIMAEMFAGLVSTSPEETGA